MSTATKPQFKAFNFGVVKDSIPDVDMVLKGVGEVAKATNTPRLVHPNDPKPEPVSVEQPIPAKTPSRRLVVELPKYLVDDIERRSVGGKTRRFVTLKAFQDAGYFVEEIDLKEDLRGGRRS